MTKHNIIIIGSGPAGYTAALYAARAEINVVIIAGPMPGGQLTQTSDVENFPGFPEGVNAFDLLENMRKQAEHNGAKVKYDIVTKIEKIERKHFKVHCQGGEIIEAEGVIIATGASAKWLPLEGLERYMGKGYHGCAVCDGAFYREKQLVVVGGGDSALEDALYLTKFATKVYLLHRRDQFRGSKILQKRVVENDKIEILYHTEITNISGGDRVNEITIKNISTGEEKSMPIDAVFVAIGRQPASDFVPEEIHRDENGYIKQVEGTMTTMEGVFVAGDVTDPIYRQAICAAGDGARAAIDIERWLES